MQNKLSYISTAALLALLLVLLSDPFMLWMPMGAQLVVLLAAAVLACVWSGFILYERASDEREALHAMHAARIAYLSGIAVLTLALLLQGLAHAIDPWIPLALGVMVIAKLVARLYSDIHR